MCLEGFEPGSSAGMDLILVPLGGSRSGWGGGVEAASYRSTALLRYAFTTPGSEQLGPVGTHTTHTTHVHAHINCRTTATRELEQGTTAASQSPEPSAQPEQHGLRESRGQGQYDAFCILPSMGMG